MDANDGSLPFQTADSPSWIPQPFDNQLRDLYPVVGPIRANHRILDLATSDPKVWHMADYMQRLHDRSMTTTTPQMQQQKHDDDSDATDPASDSDVAARFQESIVLFVVSHIACVFECC